jgi:hypothetical protein
VRQILHSGQPSHGGDGNTFVTYEKIIGSTKSSTISPILNITNGNLAYDDFDKAEVLNDNFCSISDIDDNEIVAPSFWS